MREHAVVIAGGGPTGLMLACELALAGVDVAIVERRENPDLIGARAGGLHARTIEVLDQRGIGDRFVALGTRHPAVLFHSHLVPLEIRDFPTRRNFTLGLRQNHIERVLGEWAEQLAVPIDRGRDVTGFTQDDDGVDVALSDGQLLRARYLVGCDGGRSIVRKAAGIEFAGWDPTRSWLIAEAEISDEPEWGFRHDDAGIYAIGKVEDGERVRLVLTERQLGTDREPTLGDVSERLVAVYGTDFGIHSPVWISRFTDMTRQAVTYRKQRVLLAGDAAHVHPPMGGQGLNIGVQDAVNLGWKLAQVVKLTSPDGLLDSYQAERHPVAARVLRNTMAHVALSRTDPRSKALHEIVSELLRMDEPRRKFAAMMSGLDLHYDLGDGHPLLGRRMPDLDLVTTNGPLRVFALLHQARPALLNFGEPGSLDIAGWGDRVQLVDADYAGAWELPALGTVPAPGAVLVRPDGYVAWVGDRSQLRLAEALTKWFGVPGGIS
ncbi:MULTISPECIES: FAD-dependent monooxygenase [unclassified Bradyrhizobium]|uniref:FAD-dependent monooxygenase n=1 Tax=unclassified Bradyrhizobium TaxID=2631580 RepID=UPI001BAE4EFE|nr:MULTISPECIES: FAD-dependent monooxygenase [unclassified Bradyrhizobium]MBR1204847.1 FAD-dependent monooxygenase [Bradyrhizobium sp. AUGA SZCCT0124]MBR1311933.1 FAD-dependent monooxygenase [Bradyrhizobium sp. AUGA SZCCT0051]MBR1343663.1 FAD-dependent monooxygenase [Bradyrhizobium sp. AUGA SZCCT0105]MBR1358204.1 FAD-dependent monooxygenase [Bradyrhizobium sp. AUGA SZCCT0045]